MVYLINKNSSIKYIEEFTNFGWDNWDNQIETDKIFLVNQINMFKITDKIYGKKWKKKM